MITLGVIPRRNDMTKVIFTQEEINEMIRLYREENQKQDDIAKQFGSTRKVIRKYLLGVKRLYEDEIWLREQYEINKLNKREIASLANANEMTIHKYMKKYNIEVNHETSRRRKYSQQDDYFSVIDTEEKAYWLGFIVADGYVSYNAEQSTGYYRLGFQLKESDAGHLKKFIKAIGGTMQVKYGKSTIKSIGKEYANCTLRVYSKRMVEDLMALNVLPSKSTKEHMPPIEDELMRHFIRGLFDGDGCFSFSKSKQTGSYYGCFSIVGSLEVLSAAKEHLESKGFKLKIRPQGAIYNLTSKSTKEAVAIMEYLQEDATVYLERKRNKLLEWKDIAQN